MWQKYSLARDRRCSIKEAKFHQRERDHNFKSGDIFHLSSTRGAASTLRQAQTTTPIQSASDDAPKIRDCTTALSAERTLPVSVAR